jgi:hypothetical protein
MSSKQAEVAKRNKGGGATHSRRKPFGTPFSVPIERKVIAKTMYEAGNSYRAISEALDMPQRSIGLIIKEFETDQTLVNYYRENRLDILVKNQMDNIILQGMIKGTLTQDEIDNMTQNERARWFSALGVDYGIMFDKERLEKGESTENVAVIHKYIQEMKKGKRISPLEEKEA